MLQKYLLVLLNQLREGEYVTAGSLAAALCVSVKTIRIRMGELNGSLRGHGAMIEAKARYGYRLVLQDKEAYLRWKQQATEAQNSFPEGQKDRVRYLMIYLLNRKDYCKLDDLSEFLYISRTTLTNCLRQAEAQLTQFCLKLERRPNYGIRVTGAENDIRRCLWELLFAVHSEVDGIERRREQALKHLADLVWPCLHEYRIRLSEIGFENLVEDIYVAIRRMRQGRYVEAERWPEHPLEKDGMLCVQELSMRLEGEFMISFTEAERMQLALGLAGRRMYGSTDGEEDNFVIHEDIDQLVTDMLESVHQEMKLNFKGNLELRMLMNQHMVPLDIRMRYDIPLENPLLSYTREKYTMAYAVAAQASTVLQAHYKRMVPEEEIGYLAMMFALALEEKQNKTVRRVRILIVCNTGKGSARLLKYRYEREFGDYLERVVVCDLYELEQVNFDEIDYVLTTVPIRRAIPRPILEVGMFLEQGDIQQVRRLLSSGDRGFLEGYYSPGHFFSGIKGETREEVLNNLCHLIRHNPEEAEKLCEAVLRREMIMATDFGNRTALPHPDRIMVECTEVYVAVLEHPVFWNRQKVELVILALIGAKTDEHIQDFYRVTMDLVSDARAVSQLLAQPQYETLRQLLESRL